MPPPCLSAQTNRGLKAISHQGRSTLTTAGKTPVPSVSLQTLLTARG